MNRYMIFLLFGALFFKISIAQLNDGNTRQHTMASEKWGQKNYVWSHAKYEGDKPVIDFNAIDDVVNLSSKPPIVSSDEKYFVYSIERKLTGEIDSVIVRSTFNDWQQVISNNGGQGFFSADSKQYIFQDKEDLCFLKTGTGEFDRVKEIASFKIGAKNKWIAYQSKNGEVVLKNLIIQKKIRLANVAKNSFQFYFTDWFSCQLNTDSKDLIVFNLLNGSEEKFSFVKSYQFLSDGKCLLLDKGDKIEHANLFDKTINTVWSAKLSGISIKSLTLDKGQNHLLINTGHTLEYIDLSSKEKQTLWMGNSNIESVAFDGTGEQVVLVVKDTSSSNSIWSWKKGMSTAILKVSNQNEGIPKGLSIQKGASFTDNNTFIRFALQSRNVDIIKPSADAIQLDIWSYQDQILQNAQTNLGEAKLYSAILNLQSGQVILPEMEGQKLLGIFGDYCIVNQNGAEAYGSRFWEKGYYDDSTWVISLKNGYRKFLTVQRNDLPQCLHLSSDRQYLIYFDANKECNYFSYELASGKLINISSQVPSWQLGIEWPYLRTTEKPSTGSGVKLWLNGGKSFLVYDKFHDIWQIDPSGKKAAICITNGYGRLHSIEFNLLLPSAGASDALMLDYGKGPFIGKDTLLLSAFNTKTKQHGFFRKVLDHKGDPELLSMDAIYIDGLRDGQNGMYPLRVSNTNSWIVSRQSSEETFNYYMTHDFRKFNQLTFLRPHKNYNWLNSELHSFKQLDGTISRGVLYKPENFDSTKKYPIIISFYGNLSNQLNKFLSPQYIDAPHLFENPGWMVSHGYLLFLPDIYFTENEWGPSTVNTINGAARYLSGLPYVDTRFIGATGHSNSGRFGYYLFTHSNSFGAMSLGSGFTGTNVISLGLSLDYSRSSKNNWGNKSNLETAERKAYATALGNMWDNKERWVDHTAVLQADAASSPLLLFHCDDDGDDPRAAVELYTALRRLEKTSWWLDYNNGGHTVDGNDARDFTIRYTQFFDHYLKGAPAPRWMTEGIPKYLKGVEARYELDAAGSCALQGKNHCYVCEAWNKQYKRNPAMFQKEIKDWSLDKDIKEELDKKTTEERKRLDKEGVVEQKKIVNILKNGYPEDRRKATSKTKQ